MSQGPDQKELGVEKPPSAPPARSGVIGAMFVAVLLGAALGVAAGWLFLPDYVVALAVGGALTLGAARVFVFLSSDRRGLAPLEKEDGTYE